MWWHLEVGALGGDYIMRVEPPEWDSYSCKRELREIPHPFFHVSKLQEDHLHEHGSQPSPAEPAGTWSWTSQALELWEINVGCLCHPVYSILLYQPKWTKTLYFSSFCCCCNSGVYGYTFSSKHSFSYSPLNSHALHFHSQRHL